MALKSFADMLKYKFTKTQKNLWVFQSFGGHYSDSPKYISQALHRIAPEINTVWLVKKDLIGTLPEYEKAVDIDTPEAEKLKNSAQVIVDNVYGGRVYTLYGKSFFARVKAEIYSFLCQKRSQKIYTTWHGTPLKRIGRDQLGNEDMADFKCGNIKALLGNRFTAEVMERITFGKVLTEVTGTPRNDILFCGDGEREAIRKKLDLPKNKKILLYAPTFRNDGKDTEGKNLRRSGIDQLASMDFNRLFSTLTEKFGGEWVIVCRFHYHVEKMVDWSGLAKKYSGRIINGNAHDDMAEYLACTDLLLTDASSCMFDFAVTERPCLLYFPDIENYRSRERGFYMPVDSLPFPVSAEFDGLLENILAFDSEKYANATRKMLDDLGCADSADSSERVAKKILEDAV